MPVRKLKGPTARCPPGGHAMPRARRPATTSQPELLAMLRNIKDDPEEAAPRLALAVWLQERGDPRGEFIRAQVEATRLLNQEDPWYASMRWDKAPSMEVGYALQWGEGATPEARARWDRAIALLARHGASWPGPFTGPGGRAKFRRGLLRVELPLRAFLARHRQALVGTEAWAWVEALAVQFGDHHRAAEEAARVAAAPALAEVAFLDLYQCHVGPGGIRALVASPYLGGLRWLNLESNSLGADGAAAVAACPGLAGLTSLSLKNNGLGDAGVAAVAESPHLRRLRTLDLGTNGATPRGAKALARSPLPAGLTNLGLGYQ